MPEFPHAEFPTEKLSTGLDHDLQGGSTRNVLIGFAKPNKVDHSESLVAMMTAFFWHFWRTSSANHRGLLGAGEAETARGGHVASAL